MLDVLVAFDGFDHLLCWPFVSLISEMNDLASVELTGGLSQFRRRQVLGLAQVEPFEVAAAPLVGIPDRPTAPLLFDGGEGTVVTFVAERAGPVVF